MRKATVARNAALHSAAVHTRVYLMGMARGPAPSKAEVVFNRDAVSADVFQPLTNEDSLNNAEEVCVDYVGEDVASAMSPSADGCFHHCRGNARCGVFTWTTYNGGITGDDALPRMCGYKCLHFVDDCYAVTWITYNGGTCQELGEHPRGDAWCGLVRDATANCCLGWRHQSNRVAKATQRQGDITTMS